MSATRDFLGTVIASGLELEMVSPDDVIALVSMDVLAHHLPVELKARLLTAALGSSSMSATLVLDTLGVEGIVEHAPAPLLWQIIANGATQAMGQKPSSASKSSVSAASSTSASNGDSGASRAASSSLKPSARVSRVRAGATSRPMAMAPTPDADDSAFDVDTRVGAEPIASELDVLEENLYAGDDITSHGKD